MTERNTSEQLDHAAQPSTESAEAESNPAAGLLGAPMFAAARQHTGTAPILKKLAMRRRGGSNQAAAGMDPGVDGQSDPGGAHGTEAGSDAEGGAHDVHVQRKESGAGNAVDASGTLDGLAQASRGASLGPEVRGPMEQSFGRSFADVRVHNDGAAHRASASLHASAFTVGTDVYFGAGQYQPESRSGQHLIAHELAHVAQGDGRPAARADGAGPSVSHPSDPSELAADRAADAAVAGLPVSDVGISSAHVHRAGPAPAAPPDNMTQLEKARKKADILRIVGAMTDVERRNLFTTENAAMKNVAKRLSTGDLLDLYSSYAGAPLTSHFMIFYAQDGGHLKKMNGNHWRRFIGFIGAEGVAEIRADAAMLGLMVKGAPNDVLPPWDLLDAAGRGIANPGSDQLRDAINSLSADQKATLHRRDDILKKVLPKTRPHFWEVIPIIDFSLHDAVKWMNEINVLKSLKKAQWAQLLAEAPKAEQDALIADTTLWPLVEKHCDPGILQTIRQNTAKAANAQGVFDDPVQLNAMFAQVGAPAFLALATQSTMPAPQVKDIYGKIKTATKVMPTLDGLPRGKAMGDDTGAHLRRWFFQSGESDLPILYKMFERRFGVNTGDTSAKQHKKHDDSKTTVGDFTPELLQMSWPVLERLPPAQVEGNPRWKDFLANTNAAGTIGNAYYWQDTVMMGVQPHSDGHGHALPVNQPVATNADVYWRKDGAGNILHDKAGHPIPVDMNMPMWNATLRHEIGHAVDQALSITSAGGVGAAGEPHAGAWKHFGSYGDFVDAMIEAHGGMRNGATWPAAKDKRYRKVMIAALQNSDTFLNQLTTLHSDEAADPSLEAGVIRAVWTPSRWTGQPWYSDSWVRIGGRCWQRAYDGASSLYSFDSAQRDAHRVTAYQWRAPGEWFAEIYQVYYAEQEKSPTAPVGALLRSRDPQSAALMSGRVDRGFSPQDMRGGKTQKAPGT